MLMNTPISVFRNVRSTEPADTTLGAFLNSKKHHEAIKSVREAPDKTQKDRLKKELPCATISGTFSVRNVAGILKYNGLVCLDFDAKENPTHTPASMKALLSEFGEIAYAGISVSGAGVFAIVPTNNESIESHARVVDELGDLFADEGLIYDRACKDVCRLRIISFDPNPVVNLDAQVFDAARFLPAMDAQEMRKPRPLVFKKSVSTGDDNTRERVEKYVDAVVSSGQDVTSNYHDWFRMGMALASEFGMEGETYFQRISQLNMKYNQQEASKKYSELYRNGSRVKIGTFFQILKNQGVTI